MDLRTNPSSFLWPQTGTVPGLLIPLGGQVPKSELVFPGLAREQRPSGDLALGCLFLGAPGGSQVPAAAAGQAGGTGRWHVPLRYLLGLDSLQ